MPPSRSQPPPPRQPPPPPPPAGQRVALVTGCSEGGLGEAVARRLAASGYKVYATVRRTERGRHLAKVRNLSVLHVDVSSPASVADFGVEFRRRLRRYDSKLHLLVNNAGGGMTGPLIDADLEAAKQVYDTNVWGVLAITQICAYSIIAAKGTIVNVSSAASAVNVPWNGLHASSKAAVAILSETLRVELAPLGVRVVTAMLGKVATRFHQNDGWTGMAAGSFYHAVERHIHQFADGAVGQPGEPVDQVAQEIVQDIAKLGVAGYVYHGAMAQRLRVAAVVPPALTDYLLRPQTGLDDLVKAHKLKTD